MIYEMKKETLMKKNNVTATLDHQAKEQSRLLWVKLA
jgi:hypothetical protein